MSISRCEKSSPPWVSGYGHLLHVHELLQGVDVPTPREALEVERSRGRPELGTFEDAL